MALKEHSIIQETMALTMQPSHWFGHGSVAFSRDRRDLMHINERGVNVKPRQKKGNWTFFCQNEYSEFWEEFIKKPHAKNVMKINV